MAEGQENIKQQINTAQAGLSLDQSINQVPKGKLTYALNAAIENFDANSVSYQNEPGNELCINFPEGFIVIGRHNIIEQQRCVFFLVNPDTGDNEIGYMNLNNCEGTSGTQDYDDDCPNDGAKKYPIPPPIYQLAKYEFLVIYGKCDDSWGIRLLYIEKYNDKGKIHDSTNR